MEINIKSNVVRKAKRWDLLARGVITIGGITIIASVILILLLIVNETLPLFAQASVNPVPLQQFPSTTVTPETLAPGIRRALKENTVVTYFVQSDGHVRFVDASTGKELAKVPFRPEGLASSIKVEELVNLSGDLFSVFWENGVCSLLQVEMKQRYGKDGGLDTGVSTVATVPAPENIKLKTGQVRKDEESGSVTRAGLTEEGKVLIRRVVKEEGGLFDEATEKTCRWLIQPPGSGRIQSMAIQRDGAILFAGTDDGTILHWRLANHDDADTPPETHATTAFTDRRAITALGTVFGEVSLAVGDEKGELSTWFFVRSKNVPKLRKIHPLRKHNAPVVQIVPSRRNKSLLSLDANGVANLDHMTSERHLLSLQIPGTMRQVSWAAIGNAIIALGKDNSVAAWELENPHPETSLRTLFGPVHYEGYPEPAMVWQTTGGEDFEAKFSITPLLFGTLKGTVYAMLFSIPLALFAAVYVSKFTSHEFRKTIKPAVEIMAAVPSVVIGFLIALWLAPRFEQWIVAVFLSLLTVPGVLAVFMLLWQRIRSQDWAKHVERGYEFILLIPLVVLGVIVASFLAPGVEEWLFDGNFRQWLFDSSDGTIRYDQRNCIIISFGLGFAVIPIIFSIAEDSLTNVPHSLSAASLALGASRWQTIWRVVLPSASPGIFAAIMIGFGRAIGETMIVLMATGNTPIMDWSPFNGMRTLSANIAVEIPEAPVGGTLFRTLFLCAVLLFVLTFFLNTLAEVVRDRLRAKYGRF